MKNLFFILIFFSSVLMMEKCTCKKSKLSTGSISGCRISNISGNSNGSPLNISISYNPKGTIAKANINSGGSVTISDYTYRNGIVIVNNKSSSGGFLGYDSLLLNSFGKPYYLLSVDGFGDTTISVYSYNSEGEMIASMDSYSDGDPSDSKTYQYSNGNLVSTWDGSDSSYFQYYTNQSWQQGDALNFEAQFLGAPLIANTNLIKSITTRSGVQSYVYTFDPNGKITGLSSTDTNGSPAQISYQYQCN